MQQSVHADIAHSSIGKRLLGLNLAWASAAPSGEQRCALSVQRAYLNRHVALAMQPRDYKLARIMVKWDVDRSGPGKKLAEERSGKQRGYRPDPGLTVDCRAGHTILCTQVGARWFITIPGSIKVVAPTLFTDSLYAQLLRMLA